MSEEKISLLSSCSRYGTLFEPQDGKTEINRDSSGRRQMVLVLVVLTLMITAVAACLAVGLPPMLARRAELEDDPLTQPPPSSSKEGWYVSAAVSADSEACPPIARRVLKRNGSAVDAAVATLLCLGVTAPHRSGLGGGFFMLVYTRSTRGVVVLDARETAPTSASRDMFRLDPEAASRGGMAVAVPGELRGLWEAHQRFGALPWSELVRPSVRLCERGTPVSSHLAAALEDFRDVVLGDPVLRETFTGPGGGLLQAGATMKNPRLARTLRLVAEKGPRALYMGELASQLVDELGGVLSVRDLQMYRPNWRSAVSSPLRVGDSTWDIHATPLPSSGPLLVHMLNVLEGYNMTSRDVGDIYHQVTTLHRVVETFKHAHGARPLLGDPDFVHVKKVESDLLSKEYARHIRSRIDDYGTIVNTANYGLRMVQTGDKGTTHVSILAPNGDAVTVTSSINLDFGCGKMSNSTGLILNDHMADFSLPNSDTSEEFTPFPNNYIEPGKRPLSSMVPAIFTDQSGDVRLVVGASGDDKTVTSVALVCSRYLWLGQGLKEAIDARRVHHQLVPNVLYYEQGLLRQQVDGLQHRGHRTRKEKGAWPGVNAVAREGHGAIVANSDFRMNGMIQGF